MRLRTVCVWRGWASGSKRALSPWRGWAERRRPKVERKIPKRNTPYQEKEGQDRGASGNWQLGGT